MSAHNPGADAPRLDAVLRVMDADPNATYYPGRTGSERERTDVPVIVADWNRIPVDLINQVESDGFEIDWADSVHGCDDCGHAVGTVPEYWTWTPSYAWDGECAVVCFACLESRGLRWTEGPNGYRAVDPEEWRNRSISCGTMRSEDTVPAMVAALRELGFSSGHWKRAHDEFRTIEPTEERLVAAVLHGTDEEVAESVQWLAEALDAVAPDGCYFGAHPDDGADLGFWEGEE